ncbi:winged helix family transcriptional regulator [Paenibacillus gorillae]|uniref:winged helix family transcriptional regulator n=1 Tax=Paenibacillus gorillae TaxID=1243662 RepID=UPI0004B7C8DD|nr:response regulator transcription factor [Paenibacillus gorillae]
MQSYNDSKRLRDNDDAGGLREISFCETTRRIIIISPLPAVILPLVMSLMVRCYDVLIFHHENDPILTTIPSDLLIIDRSKAVSLERMKVPSSIPVLFLLGDEQQLRSSNDHAALVWPCPILEALEKIEQMVNQNQELPQLAVHHLRFKNITMDLKRFSVYKSGSKIQLTMNEFNLLKILISVGGAAMTRDQIIDELCGEDYFGGSNFVDVHIKSLRHKLEDNPKRPKYIITVRGVGYRISND